MTKFIVMSFKVTFSRKPSTRLGGHVRILSCTMTCTNWLMGETVDIMLCDCYEQQPWFFRNTKFKAGESYVFDFDTVDWEWKQGDYIAIVDGTNKVIKKWTLQLPEYGPGQCPECHGTHKCKHCHGQGFVYPSGKVYLYKQCDHCGGTGICQTCNVPYRKPPVGGVPTGLKPIKL